MGKSCLKQIFSLLSNLNEVEMKNNIQPKGGLIFFVLQKNPQLLQSQLYEPMSPAWLYTFTKRVPFLETLTTKSPILVQKKMTTKIHPSTTVIKNPSKKQHVKSYVPRSENQWKESSKTLAISEKLSKIDSEFQAKTCTVS